MTSLKKKGLLGLQKNLAQLKLEKDWLRWLLSLQEMDLEYLSLKERENLQDDVIRFVKAVTTWLHLGEPDESIIEFSQEDLITLQRTFQKGLRSFNADSVEVISIHAEINRIHLSGYYDKNGFNIRLSPITAEPISIFWLGVGYFLETYGTSIRMCEECSKIFLRSRRQEYCSKQCSQRVRTRRWYEIHKEEAKDKRRQTYEQEMKKKHPKAVVQRRKPKPERP